MEDTVIVDTSYSAIINAPLDNIDIPAWCFSLPDEEYQGCSPAHVAAGATRARDGRRMSINVEVIGGTPMVQHYVEQKSSPHHLLLRSISDLFTSSGRTTMEVNWELSVKAMDDGRCEFTNRVYTRPTEEFSAYLDRQGIPFDLFRAQRQPVSAAHNAGETPLFAASIERHALRHAKAAA
ncbi:hypothetical protein LQ772_15905 [Frateuria edaphi]|uniref:hypothetical protein n=1 Tax=Frateuria edaphi TaxID=2898793 RepID=UPI001E3923C5|nr:hypothetical protein [Frateuria edaphi]UGB45442.1 hypothetical protein LQ772_15905 [Frateuria edaphi]